MTAFVHHFAFEFRSGIRNKQLLLMNYLFPLGFYLLMGFLFPQILPTFLESLIPSLVVFAVVASALLGIPDPLVNAREAGIYRSYRINGIPSISILAIPAISTIVHLTVVTLIITLTAPILFDPVLPVNWLGYIVSFLAIAVACTGLGILVGVVSPSTRLTVLFSQLVFLPSMLLGGLMMPSSMLPESVARFARLLPATHAMNAFDSLAMGREPGFAVWTSVAVLVSGGLLAFGLAVYLFNWDRHNSARRGHPLMGLLAVLPYVAALFIG